MARPSQYTQELADQICAQLAVGDSMRTISKKDNMPGLTTMFSWLRQHEEFQKQYAIAKEECAEAMAEDIIDIADDGSNDFMTITKGDLTYNVEDREVTNRSRLRVDARKWVASKLKPKKYGDKLDLTSGGEKLPTPIFGGKSTTEEPV